MTSIDPQQQLEFLSNIQRLLSEGQFISTYKYALLLAIADICVEDGRDDESTLTISTACIAEKFIAFYWPQSRQYEGVVLRQNTGKNPAVIRLLNSTTEDGLLTLHQLRKDGRTWSALVGKVGRIVREMPLWKLQTIGSASLDFLYPNTRKGKVIELKPGVMYCFRRFHGLVSDLVRGAWLRYVRRFNGQVLGEPNDLDQFLFGTERASLEKYAPILREVQDSKCLYCEREVGGSAHIDHFIPWSKYPVDLGHNFVLAHDRCNGAKGDHLAGEEHLMRWVTRNRTASDFMQERFDERMIIHSIHSSEQIARWAYAQTAATSGMAWVNGKALQPVSGSWLHCLS